MLASILAIMLVATNLTAIAGSENNNKGSCTDEGYYEAFDVPGLTNVSIVSVDGTTVIPMLWAGTINSQDIEAKENGSEIEQGVKINLSPQSMMNNTMTSDLQVYGIKFKTQQTSGITTQMQEIKDAQWRNSYNLNSGLDVLMMKQGSGTAVPRIWLTSNVSELSTEPVNIISSSNENLAALITNRTYMAPRTWLMISSNEPTLPTALSSYS